MVFLICTLLFFSSQMRDDPLPTEAVSENLELNRVNEDTEVTAKIQMDIAGKKLMMK